MSRNTIAMTGAFALCMLAALPPMAGAAGQDGMVVVRDPQTGQLRAPTPQEARALRATTPAAAGDDAARTAREPSVATRRDGARGVRLGDRTMVYEVVTRGADGTLSTQCVHGDKAAHDALDRPATDHKEPSHEAR
jgi:hypothetical protein